MCLRYETILRQLFNISLDIKTNLKVVLNTGVLSIIDLHSSICHTVDPAITQTFIEQLSCIIEERRRYLITFAIH